MMLKRKTLGHILLIQNIKPIRNTIYYFIIIDRYLGSDYIVSNHSKIIKVIFRSFYFPFNYANMSLSDYRYHKIEEPFRLFDFINKLGRRLS